MKKIVIILTICLFPFAIAREDVPLLIDNSSIITEYEESSVELIDLNKMRRGDKVREAQKEAQKNMQTSPIKLDTRAINHQRALDYTTRQNNSMIPFF